MLLNGQIALGDLLLQLAVVLQRLADHEEQFGPVIAGEGRFELGLTLLDPGRSARQASFFRSRSPPRMASKIARPLLPLRSVST